MKLEDAYKCTVDFLKNNTIEDAEFKARCLICSLADIPYSEFYSQKNASVDDEQLDYQLFRLKMREPLQYLIGKWDFYESEFEVGYGVLIPRPETEELVDMAVKYAGTIQNPVIIDLCSGSGCIGISLAKAVPDSTVYCIEKSEDAFRYLKLNSLNVKNIKLINADINDEIGLPKADIIISNPPYIKSSDMNNLQEEVTYEPAMALDGGEDGLDFYRIIDEKWTMNLKKDGVLFLEIGEDQGKSIYSVLKSYNDITVKKDINGNDRMVVAKR